MKAVLDTKKQPKLLTQGVVRYQQNIIRSNRFGLGEWTDGSLIFVKNLHHAWKQMSIVPAGPNNSRHVVQHLGENVSMYLKAYKTSGGVKAYTLTSQPEGENPILVELYFTQEPKTSDGQSSNRSAAGPSKEQLTEPTLPVPGQ
jgi:hypothetical protein